MVAICLQSCNSLFQRRWLLLNWITVITTTLWVWRTRGRGRGKWMKLPSFTSVGQNSLCYSIVETAAPVAPTERTGCHSNPPLKALVLVCPACWLLPHPETSSPLRHYCSLPPNKLKTSIKQSTARCFLSYFIHKPGIAPTSFSNLTTILGAGSALSVYPSVYHGA